MIGPLPVYMELVGDVKMNRIALPIGSMYGILTYIYLHLPQQSTI